MSPSKSRRKKRDYLPAPPELWAPSRGGGGGDVDGAGDADNADAEDSAAETALTHNLPTQNHNPDHDPFLLVILSSGPVRHERIPGGSSYGSAETDAYA